MCETERRRKIQIFFLEIGTIAISRVHIQTGEAARNLEFNVFRKLSDEELLRRMSAGDADAFGKLYDRRQSNVYRYALRMSGSSAFAEDVTQDVFIALMRDAHQFDETRGTVAAYLFGITRHRVLRKLERERTFASLTAQEESDENSALDMLFVTDPHPLDILEQQELIETVQQAVLSLPTHYREVVFKIA